MKEKKEKYREYYHKQEVDQFKFKPQVNKKSERMIRERSCIMQMYSPPKKSLEQQL